jgi:undecaprenyl-diphosphatase
VLLAVAALVALAVSAVLVSDQHVVRGEAAIFEAVNGWPRWIGAPLEVVMQLGTLPAAIVLIAGLAAVTLPQRPRPVLALAVATFLAYWLDDVVKELVERPRPGVSHPEIAIVREDAEGFGFPSGHTTMAFALATVLYPLLPPRWRWLPFLLASAVGVARLYVGVHWPMDVVGGAALGIAIGAASSAVVVGRYGPRRT